MRGAVCTASRHLVDHVLAAKSVFLLSYLSRLLRPMRCTFNQILGEALRCGASHVCLFLYERLAALLDAAARRLFQVREEVTDHALLGSDSIARAA
jgi:hypothetical protein